MPYKEHGYDVRLVTKGIGVENYHPPNNVYGIIANPPCTMFSIARTNAKTPRDLVEGMRLVKECLRIIWECQYNTKSIKVNQSKNAPLAFWVIENPAGSMLKWFLGRPAYTYQPFEFGENYSKNTSLWGYFNKPIKPLLFNPIPSGRSLNDLTYKIRDAEERMQIRSRCSPAFAKAFFQANP